MLPILTIKAEPFPIIMREFRHTESEKGADSVSDKNTVQILHHAKTLGIGIDSTPIWV